MKPPLASKVSVPFCVKGEERGKSEEVRISVGFSIYKLVFSEDGYSTPTLSKIPFSSIRFIFYLI